MGEVNGTFIYNGQPLNGATAKLWMASGFASAPSLDDDEPSSTFQVGSDVTTGVAYGGDGAFRWTNIDDGRYYISCYYDTHRAWLRASVMATIAKLKPALTRWVIPGWYCFTSAGFACVANRIYYIPIFVSKKTTYIRIGIFITGSVAGDADLRIFEWDNGIPGALILSAGTIDHNLANAQEIVISQELVGYAFLAVRCTGAPTFRSLNTGGAIRAAVAGLETAMGPPAGVFMAVDAAYADPAPAPTIELYPAIGCVFLREN